MYCLCCGGEFDEPKEYREYSEFWGFPATETILGCPYCGGSYAAD